MIMEIAAPIAITLADAVSMGFYFILVTALAFVVLCALASYLRFEMLAHSGSLSHKDVSDKSKLRLRIAGRLATRHRTPEPFSLLLINLPVGVQAADEELEARVRAAVRSDDDWVGICDGKVAVLLESQVDNISMIIERLLEAIGSSSSVQGDKTLGQVRIGAACFPEHAQGALELMERAEEAWARTDDTSRYSIAEAAGNAQGDEASRDDGVSAEGAGAPLTGVLEAERLPLAVQKFVARYRRASHPVSVLYMEIDNLRRYSAHYGEDAVGEIQRLFASLIQKHVRDTDLLGRYAEEEFVAVLPCTTQEALNAAQRLAGAVKRHPFTCGQATLKITISAGVAGYPDHGKVPRRLLECAYAALEMAKQRGQNLCLLYQPNMKATVHGAREADIF